MPVYHFTLHAHGTWLPDRPEGYYRHGSGWKPPSEVVRQQYNENMQGQPIAFDLRQQQLLIDEAIKARPFQRFTLYAAATDSTHLHAVVAWQDDRDPTRVRAGLKSSLTRALNAQYRKRQWFVAKSGQNQVSDETHLSDLVHNYLPKHTLYWFYKSADAGDG